MRHKNECRASYKPTRIESLILIPKWNLQDISPERLPAPDTSNGGVLKTRTVYMLEVARANMRAQHTGPPWTVLQCATESSREPVVVTEPKCHEGKPGRRITPIEGKTSAQNKLNTILGSRCSVKSTAWLALLPFCSKFFLMT